MRSLRSVWVTLPFILIFSILSLSQNQPSPDHDNPQISGGQPPATRGPSTAEERAKALKYARDGRRS